MKCCDNCGKWLSENSEKFVIGISSHTSQNYKDDILNEKVLLCDTCLNSLKEEMISIVNIHRRFEKIKIDEKNKMEYDL